QVGTPHRAQAGNVLARFFVLTRAFFRLGCVGHRGAPIKAVLNRAGNQDATLCRFTTARQQLIQPIAIPQSEAAGGVAYLFTPLHFRVWLGGWSVSILRVVPMLAQESPVQYSVSHTPDSLPLADRR